MKLSRDKLQRRIESLEANMAFLAKEYSTGKQLANELASVAHELMEDANVEDQPFVLAETDRLRTKYDLPHVGPGLEFSNKPAEPLAIKKCAHPSCVCRVQIDGEFCSDHCETMVEARGSEQDEPCECGHSDCVVKQAQDRLEARDPR